MISGPRARASTQLTDQRRQTHSKWILISMAELLSRGLQRVLLERLQNEYPSTVLVRRLDGISDEASLKVNLAYLNEHGLVDATIIGGGLNQPTIVRAARITAAGIDFLANDGGLSAILGVVTVKLHEDTIKDLVATKIDEADLPEAEKSTYKKALKELPGEATKHLVLKLVDAGLENWPKALPLIQGLL